MSALSLIFKELILSIFMIDSLMRLDATYISLLDVYLLRCRLVRHLSLVSPGPHGFLHIHAITAYPSLRA